MISTEREAINYGLLPDSLRFGLRRWFEHGQLPGGFLRAVLANDFVQAVIRADDDNLAVLLDIARFMHNEAPARSWGTLEKMEAWSKRAADDERRRAAIQRGEGDPGSECAPGPVYEELA